MTTKVQHMHHILYIKLHIHDKKLIVNNNKNYRYDISLTCMNTLPMTISSSSLKTVLNMTVTRSLFASTYLKSKEAIKI